MRFHKVLLAAAVVALVVAPIVAQPQDEAGNLLARQPGLDDPLGTKLKELVGTVSQQGLVFVGDALYQTYRMSSTSHAIIELDPNTGAVKTTTMINGLPTGDWPWGLGWDTRRNVFIVGDTGGSTLRLMTVDLNGTVQTMVTTGSNRNVGAAYDSFRDGYWVTSWNTNLLQLYDARSFSVLTTINLAAHGATRAAGTAYDPVNDIVYTSSRNTKRGYVFNPGDGSLLYSYPLPYQGTNNGQGAAWYDRWTCPLVGDYETKNLVYTEAGFPRVVANATVGIGQTLAIKWVAARSPSKTYQAAASLTERVAGISFLNRYFPLAPDALFFLSLQAPAIFTGFQGTLDTSGTAAGGVIVPSAPPLVGFIFSVAYVTVDPAAPFGIFNISGPWRVVITT